MPNTDSDMPNKDQCQAQESPDDDERDPPALVVYFIEPCGFRSDNEDLHRYVDWNIIFYHR